jgi:hypothetical protein
MILPIESKLKDNDVIPKIFNSFEKDYNNQIRVFVRTSLSKVFDREMENKKVKIFPFWMI